MMLIHNGMTASVMVMAGIIGCGMQGCARYRDLNVMVRNKVTREPVPAAKVAVQQVGVVGQFGAGDVPSYQVGLTNNDGGLTLKVRRAEVNLRAQKDGFVDFRRELSTQEVDRGRVIIDLSPH